MAEPIVLRRIELVRDVLEMLISAGDGCDLIDEKKFEGTSTVKGDICRIRARIQYLIDVLLCEMNPTATCCQKAIDTYCKSFDGCPN